MIRNNNLEQLNLHKEILTSAIAIITYFICFTIFAIENVVKSTENPQFLLCRNLFLFLLYKVRTKYTIHINSDGRKIRKQRRWRVCKSSNTSMETVGHVTIELFYDLFQYCTNIFQLSSYNKDVYVLHLLVL